MIQNVSRKRRVVVSYETPVEDVVILKTLVAEVDMLEESSEVYYLGGHQLEDQESRASSGHR